MTTLNNTLTSRAFEDSAAHKELGDRIADMVMEHMLHSGFMRTLFDSIEFEKTNHTCVEHSRREWEIARRIIKRAKKRRASLNKIPYRERLRLVVREIRRTNYQ